MPSCRLPYGTGSVDVDLASAAGRQIVVDTLAPRAAEAAADAVAEVETALAAAAPPPYRGGGCAVAINDHTRPVPHDVLLPCLLRFLERIGVDARDVLFVIASGTHPPMDAARFEDVVPAEVLARCRVVCHDARREEGLAFLGETSRGTPVWVNRDYLDRELRIVVGAIEPHQFVGFSGGAKGAAIGLGGDPTVTRNHAMMAEPNARIGRYDDNPCRQDIEEIGRRIGVHVALNVVLAPGKRIVRAIAGEPADVMRRGIPLVRELNQVAVARPYDMMIVSPGGHPKDGSVYQAQKAIAHAALVTRPGGTIVLVAACPDGAGSASYEEWMRHPDLVSHEAVLARFAREGYRIGAHKAFMISRDASVFRLLFHSGMPPEAAARLLLTPAPDLQRAVDDTLAGLPPGSRVGIMPMANATIPVLKEGPGL
jgi:nickel-dependent lactate racemase